MNDETDPFVPPLPQHDSALGQDPTGRAPSVTPHGAGGTWGEEPTTPQTANGTEKPIRVFGRYELLEEIARGGMGIVYRAWDGQVGRTVALKMIRAGVFAQPDEVERFCRETQAVVQLSHPHIIQVYDVDRVGDCPYFTMQLAPGGSLDRRLNSPLPADRAVALVEKVARAVEYAHRCGILHRDLKPANVFLGPGDEPLVGDFGLAKFLNAQPGDLTLSGMTPGTPAYMAPEQAAGRTSEVGPQTDVWALGVILFELLTGQRWATGENREAILHRILTSDPPRPRTIRPEIDPVLEAVVMRCLEKEPARRYASAGELAEDLAAWLRGSLTHLPERPAAPRKPTLRLRRRWLVATLLGIVAVLTLAAGLWWSHWWHRPETPLVLMDNQGRANNLRWVVGGTKITPAPSNDGYSFSTPSLAWAEFPDEPPWQSYRLEAEVQQTAGPEAGVGICISSASQSSPQGPCRAVFNVSLSDQDPQKGTLEIYLWRVPGANPARAVYNATPCCPNYIFDSAAKLGVPAPWHALAVEVTPAELRVFLDGQQVRTISARDLAVSGRTLFPDVPTLTWKALPRGTVGFYVANRPGAGSFRNIIVRPLPPAAP